MKFLALLLPYLSGITEKTSPVKRIKTLISCLLVSLHRTFKVARRSAEAELLMVILVE